MKHSQLRLGAAKELCPFWRGESSADGWCEPLRELGTTRLVEWSRWFDEDVGRSAILASGCNDIGWVPGPREFDHFVSSLPLSVRMVAPLREPAARAYSHFTCCFFRPRLLSQGWLTQTFFHELILNATRALRAAVDHVMAAGHLQASDHAPEALHRIWPEVLSHCRAVEPELFVGENFVCSAIKALLLPGIYAAPLISLRKLGWRTSLDGRRRVLAVFLEEMSDESAYATFIRALGRLLAVDPAPWLALKFPTANRHPYERKLVNAGRFKDTRVPPTMHPATNALLQHFYARHNEALGRELGLARTPWLGGINRTVISDPDVRDRWRGSEVTEVLLRPRRELGQSIGRIWYKATPVLVGFYSLLPLCTAVFHVLARCGVSPRGAGSEVPR